MTILLLKGYNNYFNRIHKQETDITSYKLASTSYLEYTNVNFDPQDGILTSLVVGNESQQDQNALQSGQVLKFDQLGTPDYLIVHNSGTINSRWFIVEAVKIREGQYKLALKRDVLTDFYDQTMNSPCFVEKGWINDVNSPLLLNSEGMKFNQIKQSEDFIKDSTHCAWLVGYLKKNIAAGDLSAVNPITYTAPGATASIPSAGEYDWEPCIQYVDITGTNVNANPKKCFYFYNSDISFRTWYNPNYFTFLTGNVRFKFTENFQVLYQSTDFPNGDWGKLNSVAFDIAESHKVSDGDANALARKIFYATRDDEDVRNKFETMVAAGKYAQFGADFITISEDVSKYNGQLIVNNNKLYRLEVSPGQYTSYTQYFTGTDTAATNWMRAAAGKVQYVNYNDDNPGRKKVQIDYRGKDYQIIAREVVADETISFNFPVSSARNECIDATYDMFCMPIDPKALGLTVNNDDVVIKYTNASSEDAVVDLAAISETQLVLATKICTGLGANSGGSLVYDLQLLPYCPFADIGVYFENHIYGPTYYKYVIDADNFTSADCTLIYNSETTPELRGIIFYPKKANFSTAIDYVLPNETVHYEWQEIVNPTLLSQGRTGDLTRWTIHEGFPYAVTDGVWELGPNSNNPDVNVELTDGLTNAECEYINLYVSGSLAGGQRPFLSITSTELPLQPANDYSTTITGNFTVRILAHWIVPDRPEDIKVKNECDLYRLSSPNFMSMYDFKKTKLRDGLKSFNIDCTYKPFTPYIKLNPNYDNSLYAVQDFNDSMGLILSGDFSIPMLSDAWVNYELQNRNYQAIFNRQIQNLDVNQQIAKEQQQFQAVMGTITGTVGGAASGAYAGFKMGGGYGAIAGAAIGGTTGLVGGITGGILDAQWLERQQTENRDFAIDQFQYQLGNVQALNPTVTKSTPLTYNNKVWPILEYYTCTDEEKDVLRQKLKYDGMTVMAINTLRAYLSEGSRLKGKMIRLNELNDDSHIAQAIYEEVDKGFYEGE